jgi:hypothetical protein
MENIVAVDKRTVHTDALDTLGTVLDAVKGLKRDAVHMAVEPCIAAEKLHAGQHVGRLANGTYSASAGKHLGIVDPFLKVPVYPESVFWLMVYPRTITSLAHVWEHPDFPDAAPITNLYNLVLKESGANKVNTIKAIRQLTGLGLKESKDLTDQTPSVILADVTHAEATAGAKYFLGVAGTAVRKTNGPPLVQTTLTSMDELSPQWNEHVKGAAKARLAQFADDIDVTYEQLMYHAEQYVTNGESWHEGDKFEGTQMPAGFWADYKLVTGQKVPAEYEDPESYEGNFFSCSC